MLSNGSTSNFFYFLSLNNIFPYVLIKKFPGMLNVYAKKKGKGKNGNQDKLKTVIYNEPNCLRDSSDFLGIALLKDMVFC